VVVQFLLETTPVPGAPYGAGNALDFMVNNRSLLIPIQVAGVDYFELHLNCPGPNIFLWTGASHSYYWPHYSLLYPVILGLLP